MVATGCAASIRRESQLDLVKNLADTPFLLAEDALDMRVLLVFASTHDPF